VILIGCDSSDLQGTLEEMERTKRSSPASLSHVRGAVYDFDQSKDLGSSLPLRRSPRHLGPTLSPLPADRFTAPTALDPISTTGAPFSPQHLDRRRRGW
jgi:hypothetical protein